jgi:tetratricopeptide (TPR) repeat protein
MSRLTADDLDALSAESLRVNRARAATIAADLVTAVDDDRLADPDERGYALVIAAEIHERQGDLGKAIDLCRRAAEADESRPVEQDGFARCFLGELLVRAGREDEGLAELASVRPLMTETPLAGVTLAETLEELERPELAVEWLTVALAVAVQRETAIDEDDPDAPRVLQVLYELASARQRIRTDLGLQPDPYDDLAAELDRALSGDDAPEAVLFWPQPDFERLAGGSPALAEAWEPTWDAHRLGLEQQLQEWSDSGVTDVRVLVASADGFLAYAAAHGVDVADDEAEQGFVAELAERDGSPEVAWPPRRNDACWCGSGDKYKKCCLLRARV